MDTTAPYCPDCDATPPYVRCGSCGQVIEIAPVDILERVRADLKGASVKRQREVATAAGVPWSTLRKIVDRRTPNPLYDTVERLRVYYAKREEPAPALVPEAGAQP